MAGGDEREEYHYYVVASSFVARAGRGTTERLTREGKWVPYDDRWRVLTEGRRLDDEARAIAKAAQLFARDDRRRERKRGQPDGEGHD
jgi:hypothetical protein